MIERARDAMVAAIKGTGDIVQAALTAVTQTLAATIPN